MSERVILVDPSDAEIGTEEKLVAHRQGALHRALSIFVMNAAGDLLLQRRSNTKYHSGGLWSNTCCSHPRPGEDTVDAAHRRLGEEMGFDCDLTPAFSFIYRANVGEGLTEHELDHVLVGRFDGIPRPAPDEVDDWRWAKLEDVQGEIDAHPELFSVWFRTALEGLRARGFLP